MRRTILTFLMLFSVLPAHAATYMAETSIPAAFGVSAGQNLPDTALKPAEDDLWSIRAEWQADSRFTVKPDVRAGRGIAPAAHGLPVGSVIDFDTTRAGSIRAQLARGTPRPRSTIHKVPAGTTAAMMLTWCGLLCMVIRQRNCSRYVRTKGAAQRCKDRVLQPRQRPGANAVRCSPKPLPFVLRHSEVLILTRPVTC